MISESGKVVGLSHVDSLLTIRKIEMLRFIHEFGFCEVNQIVNRFNIKQSCAYFHMKELTRYGLITNARIIKYQPRAYFLTPKGVGLLKLDLPVINHIPLNVYEHQLRVIDVHIKMRMIYPDAVWITERRLHRDKDKSDFGKPDHMPDAALIFSDDKRCAIEVEISQKTKDRLSEIINGYGLQKYYREVWYFCSQNVLPLINKVAGDVPYLKIFKLSEVI